MKRLLMCLARYGRIYNNTFYGNEIAVTYRANKEQETLPVYDNIFKNNIFYKNGTPVRLPEPTYRSYSLHQPNYLLNNILAGETADAPVLDYDGRDTTAVFRFEEVPKLMEEIANPPKKGSHPIPVLVTGNLHQDPLMIDPEQGDFRLKEGSPCIDAGMELTRTIASGRGKTVEVEDALYFCDGWGIVDPDRVVIGNNPPVRLVNVDYSRNRLVLESAVNWEQGDPVNLPYEGQGPDIGAHESGTEPRKR